jgi:hypothetical protein
VPGQKGIQGCAAALQSGDQRGQELLRSFPVSPEPGLPDDPPQHVIDSFRPCDTMPFSPQLCRQGCILHEGARAGGWAGCGIATVDSDVFACLLDKLQRPARRLTVCLHNHMNTSDITDPKRHTLNAPRPNKHISVHRPCNPTRTCHGKAWQSSTPTRSSGQRLQKPTITW